MVGKLAEERDQHQSWQMVIRLKRKPATDGT